MGRDDEEHAHPQRHDAEQHEQPPECRDGSQVVSSVRGHGGPSESRNDRGSQYFGPLTVVPASWDPSDALVAGQTPLVAAPLADEPRDRYPCVGAVGPPDHRATPRVKRQPTMAERSPPTRHKDGRCPARTGELLRRSPNCQGVSPLRSPIDWATANRWNQEPARTPSSPGTRTHPFFTRDGSGRLRPAVCSG